MRTLIALSVVLLVGCASIHPYQQPLPDGCEAMRAEMDELIEKDNAVYNIRGFKEGAVIGVSVAASAGALPIGWAWAPMVAAVAQNIQAPTHEARIAYLATALLEKDCN